MRIFLTLLILFGLLSCQSESRKGQQNPLKNVQLRSPHGDVIKTTIVYTEADQTQGLSGVRPDNFEDDQGMLFFYTEDSDKFFWMPDTYFDLDLIYLDKDLKILDIIRKLPHYIGRSNPDMIPRARGVWARHVLEMKASSPVPARLKVGDTLKWDSPLSLAETEKKIKEALTQSP
jgi:uncharacterized membrane protein (UPF0127 family)